MTDPITAALILAAAIPLSPVEGWRHWCATDPAAICHHEPLTADTLAMVSYVDVIDELGAIHAMVAEGSSYEPEPRGQDVWRVLKPGDAGDCEDFAATYRALAGAIVPDGAMWYALIEQDNDQWHIVLTVNTDRGLVALDNQQWEPLPLDEVKGTVVAFEGFGNSARTWGFVEGRSSE